VRLNSTASFWQYLRIHHFETNDIILEPHAKKDIIVNFAGAEPTGIFGGELDVIVIVPNDDPQNKNIFKSILYDVMLRLA